MIVIVTYHPFVFELKTARLTPTTLLNTCKKTKNTAS